MKGTLSRLALLILTTCLFSIVTTEECQSEDSDYSIECDGNKRCCIRDGEPHCCTTTNITFGGWIILALVVITFIGAFGSCFYYCFKYIYRSFFSARTMTERNMDISPTTSEIELVKMEGNNLQSSDSISTASIITVPPPLYSNTEVPPSYSEINH